MAKISFELILPMYSKTIIKGGNISEASLKLTTGIAKHIIPDHRKMVFSV